MIEEYDTYFFDIFETPGYPVKALNVRLVGV